VWQQSQVHCMQKTSHSHLYTGNHKLGPLQQHQAVLLN
jgi:hypothetical protein